MMKVKKHVIFLLLAMLAIPADAEPEVIKLWPEKVPHCRKPKAANVLTEKRPGAWRLTEITDPELVVYPANPETHNGMALIVCPGGGYVHLNHLGGGAEIAKYFANEGFTCFVLHYQIPSNRDGALSDAMQAIKLVRNQAKEWEISRDKIGMIGTSAGGHLITALSTQTENTSARPNFSLLLCPAYLCDSKTKKLSPEFVDMKETPPFFLFTAEDDKNWVDATRVFANELEKRDLAHEVHLVPKGGHGFGLKKNNPAAEVWPKRALQWIHSLEL